jgi:hypothetical protein
MYNIFSKPGVLRDSPDNIDFHVRTGDYFLQLATKLGFLEEVLVTAESDACRERGRALANELRNDLRYIQANYAISPRAPEDKQIIHPKGNILA